MSIVTVRSHSSYQQEIIADDHVFFADEPVDSGGDDTGPNPYQLLVGALGACTAITLQMYAKRKGWDLQQVEIDLEHSKEYARDCADCADKNVKVDHITRRITLRGNLNDAQRERLIEMAKRCPVHRTLTEGHVEIEDEEVRP